MHDMDETVVEMQVACGDHEEASSIAEALVGQRLAACVQQVPIRSTYRWNGAIERDDEVLLLVKTTAGRVASVTAAVLGLHSYDVPAITAVEVVGGSEDYLAWVQAESS